MIEPLYIFIMGITILSTLKDHLCSIETGLRRHFLGSKIISRDAHWKAALEKLITSIQTVLVQCALDNSGSLLSK